jgi:hypothetical protein
MHPYARLGARAFWATAVAQRDMLAIDELWKPKVLINRNTKVATYGSCFAQHFGRALSERGFNWYVTEPAPPGLSIESARKFNYGVFSSRTANIYTTTLLKQWVSWALGDSTPPDEIWQAGDRFYDPFRPNIEPGGFANELELRKSRDAAIRAFRKTLLHGDVFVFTLGLTESWFNASAGYEYPMCPGTVAGEFDADRHVFRNQDFAFVRKSLSDAIDRIRAANPDMRFLLTVSPVPLTATMSGNHVLVATAESKAILRAVAGDLSRGGDHIDYFPSYEMITSVPFKGAFYESNLRSVSRAGVDHVMKNFFQCLEAKFPAELGLFAPEVVSRLEQQSHAPAPSANDDDDVVCEEAILEAFSGSRSVQEQ